MSEFTRSADPSRGRPGDVLFVASALLAIVVGGLLSAGLAHAPTRQLMWLVAYLVLVVGVAQGVLGIGQAWLAPMPPSTLLLTGQWCLFNAGNAWVMAGTLQTQSAWVSGGALLLVISLGLFMIGVRHARRSPGLFVYRGLLVLVSGSALLGVMLAIFRPHV